MQQFTLLEKKQLTHDVFELLFSSSESVDHQAGQFVTFILDGIGGRSYSLLEGSEKNFTLIIKRVANGKKGSICLCDSEVGTEFKGVGPVGKFVLNREHNSKLFAGTGTGFVPLYNQIISTLRSGNSSQVLLLFGVRTQVDLFYIDKLNALKKEHQNFDYKIALSREENGESHKGYITDFVDDEYYRMFQEAYLCGAPVVVDAMSDALEAHAFESEKIFTEKY